MKSRPPIKRKTDAGTEIVFPHVRHAAGIWSKHTGYMFRPRADYVLLFDLRGPRVVISNLFVFQTLDLVFLDEAKQVIGHRRRFRPFTPAFWPPRGTAYLIEVPAHLDYSLSVGDTLTF